VSNNNSCELNASSKDYKLNSCRISSDNSKLNSKRIRTENDKTSRSQSNKSEFTLINKYSTSEFAQVEPHYKTNNELDHLQVSKMLLDVEDERK